MVLVERNNENVRNGRRSRGPSPNGHGGTPDTSSDDENSSKKIGGGSTKSTKNTKTSEYEAEKIRVGRDYQALCPDLVPTPERKPELISDRALLVWSPTKDIPDSKLEEYISVAKEKYGYNGEQALGMLFWHKHDLERAVLDLANFTPFPDEWTVEDKVLFEQAFQFHGKSFHRIRQMLPDKTIASLVKYYYSWKKTRSRTSVMDRQEKMKKNEGSENGSENGSNEESDNEEKKWPIHRGIRRVSGSPPRGVSIDDSHQQTASSTSNTLTNSSSLTSISTTATSKTIETTLNQASTSSTTGVGTSITMAITGGVSSASTSNNTTGSGILNINGQQNDAVNDNNHNRNNNMHGHNSNHSSTIGNNNLYYGNSATSKQQLSINNTHLTGLTITNANDLQQSSTCGALYCTGCGVPCHLVNPTSQGKLCNSCYHHWRRTGTMRPTSGPACIGGTKRSRLTSANNNTNYNNNQQQLNQQQLNDRHKRKPPRGMYINHDDIVALASTTLLINNNSNNSNNNNSNNNNNGNTGCNKTNASSVANSSQEGGKSITKQFGNRNDELLANMDREIVSLRSQIQQNKQIVSTLKRKNSDSSEDLRTNDASSTINRINSRWNSEELLLAVEGVKKYGKDFQAIAEVIGTKTEAQVRTFFVNYRRRYNLDNVLKEFEAENAQREQNNVKSTTPPPASQPPSSEPMITTTSVTPPPVPQIASTTTIIDDDEETNIATTENNINNDSTAAKIIDDDVMEVDDADVIPEPSQEPKESPKVEEAENGVATDKIDVDEDEIVEQEPQNDSDNKELVINECISNKEEDNQDEEMDDKLNDKTIIKNATKGGGDLIIDSSLLATKTPVTTLTEITSE